MDLKNLDLKYIIVVNDYLEKYLNFVSNIQDHEYKYITINSKDLSDLEKYIENTERENLLIILSYNLFKKEFNHEIKNFFSVSYNISNPHLLIINPVFNEMKEDKSVDKDQNFYYHLNDYDADKTDDTSFYFFIKMIFNRMRDISRLDNYIINSFRTIIDSEIMKKQKQEIEKLYKELAILSKTDYLTKVLNRKAFFESMELENNRTIRNKERLIKKFKKKNPNNASPVLYKVKFSCVMIDIDHFKKVNDTYGHIAGDQVLKELGMLLRSKKIFRNNDIIGRYGGEEFIIILPETVSIEAKIPSERLREEISRINFKNDKGEIFNIYISIGISEFSDLDKSNIDIINRADKALYYAKTHGRNQAIIYEEVF